ncbi:hypothetical protein NSS79_05485 [Paenibacillus sp. FSL L8-0436]|uniref:hypothetical protein n=1 Tax=unclassified Paenibacillus TaxID=185978 RepID=UPI0031592913
MNEEEAQDQLLSQYFNEPALAPPRLVADTLRKITAAERLGRSIIAVVGIQVIVLMLLGACVLTGPLPLLWKLALLLAFGLVQTSAAAALLFCLSGRSGAAARA